MTDLLKTMTAAALGFLAFVLLSALAPQLNFAGLGVLNFAIQFAVVFLAGTIALRLGRAINRRFDTSLTPRVFVLSLGAATLIWLGYTGIAGNVSPASISVAIAADGLAILAIWWQSGSVEPD